MRQILYRKREKQLAVSKRNIFSNVDRCFSSPYRRAMETAEFIADHPVIVKELHERNDRGCQGGFLAETCMKNHRIFSKSGREID